MRPPRRRLPRAPARDFSLLQLLPNILTVGAICAGLSSIRFGVQGEYLLAVELIFFAAVIDGVDGSLARLLKSNSRMGAELDSLADFLNFGCAPGLLVYFWALQDMRSAGWLAVLALAVCCVLRLARFNVAMKAEDDVLPGPALPPGYFMGVPSPAGGLLAMLPMYISFAFTSPGGAHEPVLPGIVTCAWLAAVGLLMISRIPTWSLKAARIGRENVKFLLVGVAVAGAALLTYPWETLILLCAAYAAMVVLAFVRPPRQRHRG
ncbi:CDP-alcohol phosphatidyltransferase family protein [Frigidibacter sp. MR17.24]|uniref:CDP-alcohol phosphatidyltransferase family protein n=1 Tax=Frigidibacter sp. MR17.24 TaxID=3127345 RepID=UPI003012FB56